MDDDLTQRARLHAALAEPHRLAIVDELAASDRSPTDLAALVGLSSNLLAHHLDVLESAGVIERTVSAGDRRRRYVRLRREPLAQLALPLTRPAGTALFVCTHNSARSQLAAALWSDRTGRAAASAGTHPADRVHPGAVAAARRAGLDLGDARPRHLDTTSPGPSTDITSDITSADIVVTVCDRAHEELAPPPSWLHWSIPDPVEAGDDAAFDAVVAELDIRISSLS